MIELGKRYRDEVTGFEGIAISRHQYLYACERIVLQAEAKDGDVKELSCDAPSLIEVAGRTVTPKLAEAGRTGGNLPTAQRPGLPGR